MQSLSRMNNNSIIYDHINQVNEFNQCYTFIGQEFSQNLEKNNKEILENFKALQSTIENQWKHQVSEINMNQMMILCYERKSQPDDYKKQYDSIIEYFLTILGILEFTRSVIDLGFTDMGFNSKIFMYIAQLFDYSTQSRPDSEFMCNQSFILKFMMQYQNSVGKNEDRYHEKYLINQIFTELIEIIRVINKVKLIYLKYQFVKLVDSKDARKTVKKRINKYIKRVEDESKGKLDQENKKHIKKYIRPQKIKKLFDFMYESNKQTQNQEIELAYTLLANVVGVSIKNEESQQRDSLLIITPKIQKMIE